MPKNFILVKAAVPSKFSFSSAAKAPKKHRRKEEKEDPSKKS